MKLKFLLFWLLSMVLTGCATVEYPKQDFVGAYGRVMTVESIENITAEVNTGGMLSDSQGRYHNFKDYGFQGRGLFVKSDNGFTQLLYKLKDYKGRPFYVIEGGDARFSVGECVNYWMSNNIKNPYYPRLSKAGPNCSVPPFEPNPEKIYEYFVTDKMLLIRKLDSWLDNPVEKLIASWGKPAQVIKKTESIYELTYYNGVKRDTYINGSYSHSKDFECFQYFLVKNKIIEGWRYSGNNCE